jgi:transcriptional regulator with XRE-family HTH domain
MSIREIAKHTGLSRNTVKKYLRAGEEMPRYAKRESSSKLDPYAEKLATWLATWLAIEATKSRKQRRDLRQIHKLLDRLPHRCHILETRIDSFRFKNSFAEPQTNRRTPSTYPHREASSLTKRVRQYSMEIQGQRPAEFNRVSQLALAIGAHWHGARRDGSDRPNGSVFFQGAGTAVART